MKIGLVVLNVESLQMDRQTERRTPDKRWSKCSLELSAKVSSKSISKTHDHFPSYFFFIKEMLGLKRSSFAFLNTYILCQVDFKNLISRRSVFYYLVKLHILSSYFKVNIRETGTNVSHKKIGMHNFISFNINSRFTFS